MGNIGDLTNQNSESSQCQQTIDDTHLQYSSIVLTLGILSICFCLCYVFVGIVNGIIAIILTKKAKQIYLLNPKQYSLKSFKNLKTGYFCAMIGLILSLLYLVFIFVYLLTNKSAISTAFSSMPWDLF